MPRYAAFLRGVSPMNARMAELKACFERMGFTDVRTLRSSGNVIFTSDRRPTASLARDIEAGMSRDLPRSFPVIVRTTEHLASLLAADPFAGFDVPPEAKRVVTFLSEPPADVPALPVELDGARILALKGAELFTVYLPSDRGPVFMTLIEKTFGRNVTTRTWDTIAKCAVA